MHLNYSDYQTEVLKVYPDAKELDNENDEFEADQFWITDGHGNDISDDCGYRKNPWQSAYERIKEKLSFV